MFEAVSSVMLLFNWKKPPPDYTKFLFCIIGCKIRFILIPIFTISIRGAKPKSPKFLIWDYMYMSGYLNWAIREVYKC